MAAAAEEAKTGEEEKTGTLTYVLLLLLLLLLLIVCRSAHFSFYRSFLFWRYLSEGDGGIAAMTTTDHWVEIE